MTGMVSVMVTFCSYKTSFADHSVGKRILFLFHAVGICFSATGKCMANFIMFFFKAQISSFERHVFYILGTRGLVYMVGLTRASKESEARFAEHTRHMFLENIGRTGQGRLNEQVRLVRLIGRI